MSYKENKYNALIIGTVSILYLLNNNILKLNTTNQNIKFFCICYLNDLMCPSVLLAITNIFLECIKELRIKNRYVYSKYIINIIQIKINSLIGINIYCFATGVYWEYIYKYGTRDNNDIICYMFGGIIYYILKKINNLTT